MIWLYLSWLLLLLGASVAFYHQQPESLIAHRHKLEVNNPVKEKLSPLVMFLIGQNYYHDQSAGTMASLAKRHSVKT